MSSGEYPEVLDTITAAAEQNKAAIQEAIQSFQAAEGEFDALLGFLSLAGAGAEASGEQVDKDLAAVDSATEHAAQALAIHQAAGFTATNESAMTAQKQIAEGIRLVGKYRRGFAHLQQQTTLGAIADIA